MTLEQYLKIPNPIEKELYNIYNKESKIVIFEIGCCEGEDTIKYSRMFPNSKIYSFEPVPDNYQKTIENLHEYGVDNAQTFQIALSDNDSIIDFYLSEGHPFDIPKTNQWNYGNKSSSLLPPKELHERYDWLRLNKMIEVQSSSLYTFCFENNIPEIDLIHMDVQGAELLVLKGAKEYLNKVNMIWLEVETVELYKGQSLRDDVVDFLTTNGFIKIKEEESLFSGDILFINKKII